MAKRLKGTIHCAICGDKMPATKKEEEEQKSGKVLFVCVPCGTADNPIMNYIRQHLEVYQETTVKPKEVFAERKKR